MSIEQDAETLQPLINEWWDAICDRYEKEGIIDYCAIDFAMMLQSKVAEARGYEWVPVPLKGLKLLRMHLNEHVPKKRGRPKDSLVKEMRKETARSQYQIYRDFGNSSDQAIMKIADEMNIAEETARHWIYKAPDKYTTHGRRCDVKK